MHIELFVSPAHTPSFGWHYDFNVCIARTTGVRDYCLRVNMVKQNLMLGARPDFMQIRREVSPLATAKQHENINLSSVSSHSVAVRHLMQPESNRGSRRVVGEMAS